MSWSEQLILLVFLLYVRLYVDTINQVFNVLLYFLFKINSILLLLDNYEIISGSPTLLRRDILSKYVYF